MFVDLVFVGDERNFIFQCPIEATSITVHKGEHYNHVWVEALVALYPRNLGTPLYLSQYNQVKFILNLHLLPFLRELHINWAGKSFLKLHEWPRFDETVTKLQTLNGLSNFFPIQYLTRKRNDKEDLIALKSLIAHDQILNAAIALHTFDLSVYVVFWILDWIPIVRIEEKDKSLNLLFSLSKSFEMTSFPFENASFTKSKESVFKAKKQREMFHGSILQTFPSTQRTRDEQLQFPNFWYRFVNYSGAMYPFSSCKGEEEEEKGSAKGEECQTLEFSMRTKEIPSVLRVVRDLDHVTIIVRTERDSSTNEIKTAFIDDIWYRGVPFETTYPLNSVVLRKRCKTLERKILLKKEEDEWKDAEYVITHRKMDPFSSSPLFLEDKKEEEEGKKEEKRKKVEKKWMEKGKSLKRK